MFELTKSEAERLLRALSNMKKTSHVWYIASQHAPPQGVYKIESAYDSPSFFIFHVDKFERIKELTPDTVWRSLRDAPRCLKHPEIEAGRILDVGFERSISLASAAALRYGITRSRLFPAFVSRKESDDS